MQRSDLEFHIPVIIFFVMIMVHVYFCAIYDLVDLIPLAILPLSLIILYGLTYYMRRASK